MPTLFNDRCAVAGLAWVTPAAGFVRPWAAAVIGLLAAPICYHVVLLRTKFKIDDALDVFACHGVGGILGTTCVGIFAQKDISGISGLNEGDGRQFGIQLDRRVAGTWFWVQLKI